MTDIHRWLTDPDARRRIVALIVMEDVLSSAPDEVTNVFDRALRDSEPEVRGFAWRTIAHLWWRGDPTDRLLLATQRILLDEFYVSSEMGIEVFAVEWLDGIVRLWETIRRAEVSERRRKLFAAWQERRTRERAGEDWQKLQRKPERFLHNADPKRRIAALRVLARKGMVTESVLQDVEQIMRSDIDVGARIAAVTYIVQTKRASGCLRAARSLAQIVADESNPVYQREVAYQGIYQVLGIPVSEWPETRAAFGQFEFPDDIDWELVRHCLEA
ncbi:MAG: hypothetical protein D6725_18210 [Planctomycetota bacterium]|nr:MAG: hypothetical protein D6725_18210 [Planctomycetota bacterium]